MNKFIDYYQNIKHKVNYENHEVKVKKKRQSNILSLYYIYYLLLLLLLLLLFFLSFFFLILQLYYYHIYYFIKNTNFKISKSITLKGKIKNDKTQTVKTQRRDVIIKSSKI